MNNLYCLFYECLNIKYLTVGKSANYAVKKVGDTLYLFFQDTKGKNDWKSNFDFPAKPYKRMGKIIWFAHRGFLKVWKEIEPKLKLVVSDNKVKKINIVGYSHGAAIAVLCYEYVWFNRPDIRTKIKGYGFGCPRVFWGIPFKCLKERWSNFTVIRNGFDIVTHLPPFIFGFSHVGKMLRIGKVFKYSFISAHKSENILSELKNKMLL